MCSTFEKVGHFFNTGLGEGFQNFIKMFEKCWPLQCCNEQDTDELGCKIMLKLRKNVKKIRKKI